MKGFILQKGSFNPLHRMHVIIAEDAKIRYPDHPHIMLLSTYTCDKGLVAMEELNRRAKVIKDAGYACVFEESGLFVDTIRETRALFPQSHIVFPIGEDTLYRFFRDWEAHFEKKTVNPFGIYRKVFDNVTWLVSHRKCREEKEYSYLVKEYNLAYKNILWTKLDLDDISSTKLRAKQS